MLRALFFLLVLANLVVFAGWQGHFGTDKAGYEPERLTQQVNPEKLRIIRDPGPPIAVELACRLVAGLSPPAAEILRKHIEALGGKVSPAPGSQPPGYVVLISDLAGKALAERKASELQRLGVSDFMLTATGGDRHEIVFEATASEAAANDRLALLTSKGVRSARIERRLLPNQVASLELRLPVASVDGQMKDIVTAYPNASISVCAPPGTAQ